MSAAIKVLHTAELLEQILINVTDMKTLLLAQRVDKFWRDIISDTLTLQKKLFFKPAATDELASLCMVASEHMKEVNERCSKFGVRYGRSAWNSPPSSYALLNQLLLSDASHRNLSGTLSFEIPPQPHSNSSAGAVVPSFKRMMVTQPPTSDFWVIGPFDRCLSAGETVEQVQAAIAKQTEAAIDPSLAMRFMVEMFSARSWEFQNALQREQKAWPQEVVYEGSDYDEEDNEHSYEDDDEHLHVDKFDNGFFADSLDDEDQYIID